MRYGPNLLFCMPTRTSCVPTGFSDDDPINGCRIGTQCPILYANRTKCALLVSVYSRALAQEGSPARRRQKRSGARCLGWRV
jgi:hypothetical protein